MNAPAPTTPSRVPPGPRAILPGRILYRMSRDIVGFLTAVQQNYGDVSHFRIGRRRLFLLTHPEHIRQVLVSRDENFTKGPALRMAKVTLGEGLLTSEGDFHRRQRRMMQPAFHAQRVAEYADTFVRFASRTRDRWTDGQVLDVRAAMTQLTLEIVAKTLFDADLESEVREIGEAMDTTVTMFDRSRSPLARLLNLLPLPSNYRFLRARDRVFTTIDRMIDNRRGQRPNKNDFLSILLRARDTEGDQQGMTDEQVRFEAMTLFSAGHETTANAMVWTWLLLSQNATAETELHKELDRVLGGRLPTHADVPQLAYTRAVIAESMRLYPPAWIVARQAKAAHAIADTGFVIPTGGVILMPQWIVHRDPRWWPEPDAFRPERWVEERKDEEMRRWGDEGNNRPQPSSPHPLTSSSPHLHSNRPRYAYFPFGGGSRQCIGEPFAWLEAILLLATLAQRWRLRRASDDPVRLHPTITLRPRDPLPMRLESRCPDCR
ncbi:MAG TPA: cytochrome P450 [Tepidisphaeraceae bacterium]